LHVGNAVAHDQTHAGRNLAMVQRTAFVISLLFAITMTKYFRRLEYNNYNAKRATRFVFYLFGMFGIAANVLQLYNAGFLGAFWPFFTGIAFQVITALFQFCAHDPPAA